MLAPPKIKLILPYFGKFPNYFPLFLHTCGLNHDVDWLILTDCPSPTLVPNNVEIRATTLAELKDKISQSVGMEIVLPKPYKLCDYKPAYGLVFADDLMGYDFWGHCDLDILWGNLRRFLTLELLCKYDKIYMLGQMSLYRNSPTMNKLFMDTDAGVDYRKIFLDSKNHTFDEYQGVGKILSKRGISYTIPPVADINPKLSNIRHRWDHPFSREIFYWMDGGIYQQFSDGRKIEYSFIHYQRRPMAVPPGITSGKVWLFTPGRFVVRDNDHFSTGEIAALNPPNLIHDGWQITAAGTRRIYRIFKKRTGPVPSNPTPQ